MVRPPHRRARAFSRAHMSAIVYRCAAPPPVLEAARAEEDRFWTPPRESSAPADELRGPTEVSGECLIRFCVRGAAPVLPQTAPVAPNCPSQGVASSSLDFEGPQADVRPPREHGGHPKRCGVERRRTGGARRASTLHTVPEEPYSIRPPPRRGLPLAKRRQNETWACMMALGSTPPNFTARVGLGRVPPAGAAVGSSSPSVCPALAPSRPISAASACRGLHREYREPVRLLPRPHRPLRLVQQLPPSFAHFGERHADEDCDLLPRRGPPSPSADEPVTLRAPTTPNTSEGAPGPSASPHCGAAAGPSLRFGAFAPPVRLCRTAGASPPRCSASLAPRGARGSISATRTEPGPRAGSETRQCCWRWQRWEEFPSPWAPPITRSAPGAL